MPRLPTKPIGESKLGMQGITRISFAEILPPSISTNKNLRFPRLANSHFRFVGYSVGI